MRREEKSGGEGRRGEERSQEERTRYIVRFVLVYIGDVQPNYLVSTLNSIFPPHLSHLESESIRSDIVCELELQRAFHNQ